MARFTVDNAGNIFPNGEILKRASNHLNIYEVQEAFEADWKWEIAEWGYEYATAYWATFKDGSKISVAAWAAVDESKYNYN
jgi:hypothetical protein